MSHAKRTSGERAATLVTDGMVVGMGTGSTAVYFVKALAARVRDEGLRIRGIATSSATRALAEQEGIPLVALDDVAAVDLTVDGADEIGPGLALIKGGGAALLWEKIVASASRQMVVIADVGKVVPTLGRFPLPVEVMPLGWTRVRDRLSALGAQVSRRDQPDGSPLVTDGGHWILDARFGRIEDPAALARTIDGMTGVVEHGLFVGLAQRALIGRDDGTVTELVAESGLS